MNWHELLQEHKDIPSLDLERLGAKVLKTSRAFFLAHLKDEVLDGQKKDFETLVAQSKAGVPIQYLLAEAWFYGRCFFVSRDVLIPRFDTETLIDAVLDKIPTERPAALLDLCTGSGIIAITMKKERPCLEIHASDISEAALLVAQQNANRLEATVYFHHSDILEAFKEQTFDVILCNPPYVSEKEWQTQLTLEVKNEPKNALVAADEGLAFYKILAKTAAKYLTKNGFLAMEIGYQQAQEVKEIFQGHFWRNFSIIQDEQGLDRVVIVEKA